MLALSFSFPAHRYHATPWGRHVNEADVAWPPEPWRILRALIAVYWRKGACRQWSQDEAADLIDALAEAPPVYYLPEEAIHAHTRHYMPAPVKKTLVFDAFAHLPNGESIVVAWPSLMLEPGTFDLVTDLADGVGYLGRTESWVECTALAQWDAEQANCLPVGDAAGSLADTTMVLVPQAATGYAAERSRIMAEADAATRARCEAAGKRPPTPRALERARERTFGATLPERLLDALAVETADYQKHGWTRPPAAREVSYARTPLSPLPRRGYRRRTTTLERSITVARYLLAGRPQPRVEDTVRIGELMRLAALAQFGWRADPGTGRKLPQAPPAISGRQPSGGPLRDPAHLHAFWLPEDADGDGKIDHVSVYVAAGLDTQIRSALDRITRLWVASPGSARRGGPEETGRREWRLALEGFGSPEQFADASALFGTTRVWQSATPFLPTAHLKRTDDAREARWRLERGVVVSGPLAEATGYPREVRRLLQRRGMLPASLAEQLKVDILPHVTVGGMLRRPLHYHRFRTRGREKATDAHGALLRLRFPDPVPGPVALGYGCHFGLGLFTASPEEARGRVQ